MNAIMTPVPSSGIPADTSKATRKPLTPEQRERKNAKLREARAAAAEAKRPPIRVSTPPPAAVAAQVQKEDPIAADADKGKDKQKHKKPKKVKPLPLPKALPVDPPKNKGGRTAIYGTPMSTHSFKCTDEQHATYLRAGGNVYLRARLDELTAYYAKGGK